MTKKRLEPLRTFDQCNENHRAYTTEQWLFQIAEKESARLDVVYPDPDSSPQFRRWCQAQYDQAAERLRVIEWLRHLNTKRTD